MIATGRFIDSLQIADKQSGAGNNFSGIGASPGAPPEVITEAFDNLFIQIMSGQALSDGPPNDSLC
jgi:hypothetical protein